MDFSTLVTPKGYSRVDYAIITKNPNKSIDDLIELGLTKKGADALKAMAGTPQKTPQVQTNTQSTIAQPQSVERVSFTQPNRLTTPKQSNRTDTAKLYNGRTGLTVPMSRKAAEKLQRSNSQIYKIVG